MKRIALSFMAATVALAIVCLLQSRKLASQEEQVTSLNAQAEQQSKENEFLRATEKSASEEVQELQRVCALAFIASGNPAACASSRRATFHASSSPVQTSLL